MTKTSSLSKWMLPAVLLLAVGAAAGLSCPAMSVQAWYQSPVSPVSPVLSTPVVSPAFSSTPAIPAPEPPRGSGRSAAALLAGGIVLAGLIAGAVILLMRGEPPEDILS